MLSRSYALLFQILNLVLVLLIWHSMLWYHSTRVFWICFGITIFPCLQRREYVLPAPWNCLMKWLFAFSLANLIWDLTFCWNLIIVLKLVGWRTSSLFKAKFSLRFSKVDSTLLLLLLHLVLLRLSILSRRLRAPAILFLEPLIQIPLELVATS